MTRRTHARFTDFRIDWRSVCRGIDDSCSTACGGIDGSCWTVCAGIGGSRGGVLCAINCFGAPLVGARGFLGFRPLLFGMEREPAAPAGSTLFTFQDIAEYTGPLGGSRPRHHVRGKRSAVLSHECSIFVRGRAAPARDSRQDASCLPGLALLEACRRLRTQDQYEPKGINSSTVKSALLGAHGQWSFVAPLRRSRWLGASHLGGLGAWMLPSRKTKPARG